MSEPTHEPNSPFVAVPIQGVDYHQALDYLLARIDYERLAGVTSGYRFRLRRMGEILTRLELTEFLHEPPSAKPSPPLPRPPIPLVHLAGTKGKGSTAAMVAAMLTASGFRTGLYTSPHLDRLEERFRVDGELCVEADFVALVDRVRSVADELAAGPQGEASFFELTTAMALLHFQRQRCDAVVLEVGLGGRLDSTNVCHPSVTAIISIGLDHQHVLGDTHEQIAAEKAGIIKSHIPMVCGVREPKDSVQATSDANSVVLQSGENPAQSGENPARVIADIARRRQAPFYQLGVDFDFTATPCADWGTQIDFRGSPGPLAEPVSGELKMEGEHQAHNASIAIAIVQLLRSQGYAIDLQRAMPALSWLTCDARIERFELPDGVLGIVDAAHNADSVAALCQTLRHRFPNRPAAIVFGTSRDKPAAEMLRQLAPLADHLVLTRFHGNPRYIDPQQLRSLAPESLLPRLHVMDDPRQACDVALQSIPPGGLVVVCGSFFLAAETRSWMRQHQVQG